MVPTSFYVPNGPTYMSGLFFAGEAGSMMAIGTSLPADKIVDDEVFPGTINRFGAIDIQAAKVGEGSSCLTPVPASWCRLRRCCMIGNLNNGTKAVKLRP